MKTQLRVIFAFLLLLLGIAGVATLGASAMPAYADSPVADEQEVIGLF